MGGYQLDLSAYPEGIGEIRSIAFSQNDFDIAVGAGTLIYVWPKKLFGVKRSETRMPSGKYLNETGHKGLINGLSFCHNDALLVSGSEDYGVRLWRTEDWRCVMAWNAHEMAITSLLCTTSPTGGVEIVTGSYDKHASCWAVETDMAQYAEKGLLEDRHGKIITRMPQHRLLRKFRCTDAVLSVAVIEADRMLLCGTRCGTAEIWDLEAEIRVRVLYAATGAVNALVCLGSRFVTGADDEKVRIWDATSIVESYRAPTGEHADKALACFITAPPPCRFPLPPPSLSEPLAGTGDDSRERCGD